MIYKNAKVGSVTGVTVCEMGFGGVTMVPSNPQPNTPVSLLIKSQNPPTPIGVKMTCEEKTSDEYKPELVLMFHNEESIDAVISSLQDCKEVLRLSKIINEIE